MAGFAVITEAIIMTKVEVSASRADQRWSSK
jgi:hypothetical protein